MKTFFREFLERPLGELLVARLRAFLQKPPYDEPWPKEIDDAVRSRDAAMICHHCLTPQTCRAWFCPECGAVVGPYNNSMHYLQIFSLGEVLRSGVGPEARFTKLTVIGYVVLGLEQYSIFAPFYFFRIIRRRSKQRALPPPNNDGPALVEKTQE